ncbi:hypothetical protein JVU11DRAFT_11642 [Chiua virens]|nr:hypothetical protein JVU11DRAFT_11642 [Chiua virens]
MEIYLSSASIPYVDNPEYRSIMVLTALELWVALDKMIVEEIPILTEYSPEIPIWLLESLLLCKQMNLHRLSRVYQYLSARYSRSRAGLSVLSDEFTPDSFAVRFYDSSPALQQFKIVFEEASIWEVAQGGELAEGEARRLALTLRNGVSKSLLSLPPLCAKVIMFELHCPLPLRIWRSCIGHLLYRFDHARIQPFLIEHGSKPHDLLLDIPELRPFLVQHLRQESPTYSQFHPAYLHPQGLESHRGTRLGYAFRWILPRYEYSRWHGIGDGPLSQYTTYYNFFADGSSCKVHTVEQRKASLKPLAAYIANTTHTSNEILAAQTDCPREFILDEFIALGHLRSGSSLQWVNILRELRGRTLSFRSHEVHLLLAQAVCQVGPLDLDTGEWTWHQELQNPTFCNTFLKELESLFLDVAASSLDHVMMRTISLLLTRLLASNPRESILERALQLLRDVRWKTLEWVQELAYNLILEPTFEGRRESLYNMAATCRSTFDVDTSVLPRLFLSAQDVDALLSCAFFTKATTGRESAYRRFFKYSGCVSCHSSVSDILDYSELLHQQDCRLSITLEVVLKNVIQADVSNRGIDLAIRSVWPGYRPSPERWEPKQRQQSHILVCTTAATVDRDSQLMHINLLDESLFVDGRPLGGLPHEIRGHPLYKQIFYGQALVVTPSDLPGMDFATLAIISSHRLHFSLRGEDLVIRAQHRYTDAVLELIPSEKLNGDLPTFLVEMHVHWLRLSESLIEIRPHKHLWEQSPENWQIIVGTDGGYRMHKGFDTLVDIKSRTWKMVSSRLDCLDLPEHLVVTTSAFMSDMSPTAQLSVTLPCYDLSFFVNAENDLESGDFKGMICDDNQCIGTLFGLVDRLVLRAKGRVEDGLIPRQVLVPLDAFRHTTTSRLHVTYNGIAYLAYTVDTELGCLTGNSSRESKAFLGYLHAKTSIDWKPDPLTGTTGCQEAWSIVYSAGAHSLLDDFPGNSSVDLCAQYPQIDIASRESEYLSSFEEPLGISRSQRRHVAQRMRGAKRAAHLFQPNSMTPTSEDYDYKDHKSSESELEDTVHTAASALFPIDVRTMDIVSKWTEIWGNTMRRAITHPPSPYDEIIWNSNFPEVLLMKMHELLRETNDSTRRKFQVLFLLPTVAYCSSHPQAAFLSMLLALAKDKQHSWGNPLFYVDYQLLDGYSPTDKVLRHLIHASRYENQSWDERIVESFVEVSVERLLRAWPSDTTPTLPLFLFGSGFLGISDIWDVASMTRTLQTVFSSCYRNLNLKDKLLRILQQPDTAPPAVSWAASIQTIPAGRHCTYSPPCSPFLPSSPQHTSGLRSWSVKLDQLFFDRPAPMLPDLTRFRVPAYNSQCGVCSSVPSHPALDRLYSFLRTNKTDLPFREQYITDLHASALHVREEYQMIFGMEIYPIEGLEEHFRQCKARCSKALRILKESLGPTANPLEQALDRSGQWPKITVVSLSRCLATTSPIKLSKGWRKCLVSFVLLLLELQRSRRLLLFALKGLEEEFSKELENEGCDGWDAEKFPDWLLIQLQGNFLIRRTQANVAMEMISPRSGESTVMQVNMGEGKSSVIIPIIAATLADGHQLVRVVVPKALVQQMVHVLISRLAGLVNRRIYQFSYSRRRSYDPYDTLSECMEQHGILVTQPEGVLSLKLASVEMQLPEHKLVAKPSSGSQSIYDCSVVARQLKASNDSYLANLLRGIHMATKETIGTSGIFRNDDHATSKERRFVKLQKWHHSHARDILDESDEILHPRFQLIYTVGHQQHMDGYPDRWSVTQQIMRLVKRHARSLSMSLPDSVEFKLSKPGSFPYVRILRTSDAGRRLILLLLHDVMSGHLPSFRFQHLSQTQRDAIRHFLSFEDIHFDRAKEVEEYAKQSQHSNLWGGLLLLRGLFACDILLFALTERRWRVDYGVIPDRWIAMNGYGEAPTMLAVPYRAKDVPAPYTQFGHPDITILLTCLSYYYTGLSKAQLRVSFQILLDEDDPTAEYALWVGDCGSASLPPSLQHLGEFNLESSEQWDKYLYPIFSCNQTAIDFYLSRVVFPKEAKEFPWKLGGSSWDIAEKKERPITGFSGTNDSRYLLPMSITQLDLDHQQGTNARVLGYLLQPENDSYALITHEDSNLSKTREFLKTVVNQIPEIRVLLDVGAQILDVSNKKLAEEWLGLTDPGIAGAVYFDDDRNELRVLTKNRGTPLPLVASPLSQQLDRCVIYLDDAHTRGTDLKFPKGFRAAVTLGPKVTKDRLVQGCMRMRRLGHGHSVMFFAPLEVDLSIRFVTQKEDAKIPITAADILRWAIHETLTDIQERAPYWAQQGMSHQRRYDAWSRYCKGELVPDQLADAWLEPDAKSLTDLYAPYETGNTSKTASQLEKYISRRCDDLGASNSSNRTQLDEQLEREVNREIEREREVELPPKAELARHFLHPDVVFFVRAGTLRASSAFRPVFTALDQSSAAAGEAHAGWSPFIFATADFCETIKEIPPGGRMDQYLRPVQWVVSGRKDRDRVLVLVSPFEAHHLMPDIRVSNHVHLHVYVPRTSERMKPADDLMFYSIPPVPDDWTPPWDLIDQLNIFAGQLYLRDYDSYLRLSHFLQIQKQSREDRMKKAARYNLFNLRSRQELEKADPDSLLPSMMMLLAIRRRGFPFSDSHMGKILQGQSLTRADFKSARSTGSNHRTAIRDGKTEHNTRSRSASPSGSDTDCDEDRSYVVIGRSQGI